MKTPLFFCFLWVGMLHLLTAQTAVLDSIFTNDGLIVTGNVKEIAPDVVKYSLPNEDFLRSVYKSSVLKIRLKTGKIEVFKEELSIPEVRDAYDYEKVAIVYTDQAVKGMIKVGDIYTIGYNLQDADKSLKIKAAMMGGNVVYRTESSDKASSNYILNYQYSSTDIRVKGEVFTTYFPKIEDFKKLIGGKRVFKPYLVNYVNRNGSYLIAKEKYTIPNQITIQDTYEENKFIYIKASIPGISIDTFRIVKVGSNFVGIVWEKKGKIFNLFFSTDQ